jgi:hypothetical protein
MSVFLSVRLCESVCMELSTHWKYFYGSWYVSTFRKSVQEIQVIKILQE